VVILIRIQDLPDDRSYRWIIVHPVCKRIFGGSLVCLSGDSNGDLTTIGNDA
jgi:hypothetical protein